MFVGWSLLEVIHHLFGYISVVVAPLLDELGELADGNGRLLHEEEGEDQHGADGGLSIFEARRAHVDQEQAEVPLLYDKQS